MPTRSRKSLSPASSHVVQEGAAPLAHLVEPESESAVELDVVGRSEGMHGVGDDLNRLELEREQVLLGERVAGVLEPFALVPVGLVRDRRPQHPVRDLLAVDRRRELGLQVGRALVVVAGQVAEVALAGELPELADAAVSVHHRADAVRLVQRGQLLEALVDRGEVERVLVPGVVQVVLLVDGRDEPVRLVAVVVQLAWGRRSFHRGSPRIPACGRSASGPTERRSWSTSPSKCRRRWTGRTVVQRPRSSMSRTPLRA
jgi:hypothetical protein